MSVSTGASSGIFSRTHGANGHRYGLGRYKEWRLAGACPVAIRRAGYRRQEPGLSTEPGERKSGCHCLRRTDDATSRLPRLGSRRARRINQTPAGKCGCCQMMNGKSSPEFDELWRERERLLASITIDPLWDSTASVSDDRERLAIDPVVAAPVAPES